MSDVECVYDRETYYSEEDYKKILVPTNMLISLPGRGICLQFSLTDHLDGQQALDFTPMLKQEFLMIISANESMY